MKRMKLHAASVKAVRKRLYTEKVRQTLAQVDNAFEVFELESYDKHLSGKIDIPIYSEEEEEGRNNLCSNDDNGFDDHNNCNNSCEQDAETEITNDDSDEELIINIQNQNNIHAAEDSNEYLLKFLKTWAIRGVAHRKVDELLTGLRSLHSFLPKSHKTLLQTPSRVELQRNGEGLMWYKSITVNLNERITDDYLFEHKEIIIDVNIDGLALFNSTDDNFWPILGCLIGEATLFIIGVWHGRGKPDNLDAFLADFIHEVDELALNGYNFHGSRFPFKIRNYIFDAVARQYIKCISSHNSIYACEKCTVKGMRFRNREIFLDLNAPLRTDESFMRRDQPGHHDGYSPLEAMRSDNNGMVSKFRLDAMHLLFEGAFKRWIQYLCGYQAITYGKISRLERFNLNSDIINIAHWIPVEFNRRPRSLYYQAKFKATKWRRLLLYDGVRIFRYRLHENTYKNFLLIHCVSYILSSSEFVKSNYWILIADNIYREFIKHSIDVFDESYVVYNVHCLSHMAAECLENGTILDFSAFKYESFMAVIKHNLRSTYKPLQQLVNRDIETKGQLTTESRRPNSNEVTLKKQLFRNIVPEIPGDRYAQINFKGITLTTNEANCCFSSKDRNIFIFIEVVVRPNGDILLAGYKFLRKENYYDYPLPSSLIGIFKVSHVDPIKSMCKLQNFFQKCVILPDGDNFLCIPLLHSGPQ